MVLPTNMKDVQKYAAAADVAIVFGSAHSGEGSDRKDLLFHQDAGLLKTEDVIDAVSQVQQNTVVVAVAPGQILTDWRDKVTAILCVFLPGEQYGNAVADLIFGSVLPQGKLPLTFPNIDNEQKMTIEQWPGVPSTQFDGHKRVVYSEGQINGYRWYDKNQVKPAYAFGYGLTYGKGGTYSNLIVKGRKITFGVEVDGCDTPQIYIGYVEN